MKKIRQADLERRDAITNLKQWVKPGDTVYTILRHVSRSGMFRRISLLIIKDGEPWFLDSAAARALGWRRGKKEGIEVSGCGMDMGYHLVYSLARTLWPNGAPCIGKNCPSNDHTNGMPRPTTKREAKKITHKDGGYTLRHRWI